MFILSVPCVQSSIVRKLNFVGIAAKYFPVTRKKAEHNHNDNWFRGNLLWIAPALQSKFLSTMEHEERLVANSMHLWL